ncbi:MAG: hypothetical protein ACXVDL_15445, partial [Bacteroidia bacterium]
WIWYSMAAGLLLVVGLSFYMVNDFTKKESGLAMTKEEMKSPEEKLQTEINLETAPPPAAEAKPETEKAATPDAVTNTEDLKPGETVTGQKNHSGQNGSEAAGPTQAAPRMVSQEAQKEPATSVAANKQESPLADVASVKQDAQLEGKKSDKAGTSTGADRKKAEERTADDRYDAAEQDAKLVQTKPARAYEEAEKKVESASKNKKNAESPAGGLNESSVAYAASGNAVNSPAQPQVAVAKDKEQKEENNRNDTKTMHDESLAKGTTSSAGGAAGEGSLRRSAYFKTASFDNHDEYFRKEIDRNAGLKAAFLKYNKAFRIDITINESGKVTDVKTDLPSGCSDCKTAMEKIILQMPAWQPAQSAKGIPVKQSFYFSYKY